MSRDLWSVMLSMQADDDPRLGGRLLDLMPAVHEKLSSRGEFRRSECKMGQLRFARLCVVA